jgi:autotransporter-associated beta strand protein
VVLKLGASGVIPDLVALSIRGSSAATGNGSYQNRVAMNGFEETIHSLANGGVTSGTNRGLVINNGATNSLLTVLIDTSSATFSGDIKDGATNKISLTKNGSGTQVLSGVNTYSGGTRINSGILQIGSASGLTASGNITFGGGTLQYATGINTDISSRIKNSSSVIAVNQGSNNVTFASSIDSSNSGGLLKIGTGSLTLSGSNAFTGGVTISSSASGTLIINNNTALGTGTLTLAHSKAIINSTVSGISIANAVSVTANFTFTGTNNLTLTGNVVLTGSRQVAVSAGVLTMSGVISGSNITKTGAGTLTFSGSSVNTYTGATSISAGTLITTKCTSATASKLTQAVFTPTALTVTFGTAPLANETYRFFPGTTTQSYASAAITLVGAPGRTATYTSSTSTLRIV